MNWRAWHRRVSLLIALPFAVILFTGVILAMRSFLPWMEPEYPPVVSSELQVTFPQMLAAIRTVPEAGMQSWNDVSQIDIRPKTGVVRIRAKKDHWEVRLDGSSGVVTGVGQRRVSWMTSLHQGATFGPWVRYGLFFSSSIGVVFLFVSGLILFMLPYWRRLKHRYGKKERKTHAVL